MIIMNTGIPLVCHSHEGTIFWPFGVDNTVLLQSLLRHQQRTHPLCSYFVYHLIQNKQYMSYLEVDDLIKQHHRRHLEVKDKKLKRK